ncbi:KilA-N domain-containing protein [Kingella kingae]|uniref:KilA-N domain-containing protein n=2 Tax=Kingella kingae TaxID=504 RepID=UPI002549EAEF|nr:KilA-N domain-containing protein [Kingella kingae]MDK4631189.1 KilA-N domain-containing protein [Kingella kingae]MDK4645321.1 KilA-N domain-containing protein [Kingella kingae]MDK4657086.1 KilA-N domain-containing protein [Kingella kingae]MDK4671177.1 KilA-N domain-containing protein [Kingella kingae]
MNSIQTFNFNHAAVFFRNDGYLNATSIAKHFGKRPETYLKTQPTQDYIAALSEHLSITLKSVIDKNQLVIIKKGSSCNGGGTWLHPKLAVDFARWLDPKFAVWCDEQIEQIISGSLKLEPVQPVLPHGSIVLSAHDLQCIEGFVAHVPYMLAYYRATETAVRSLNHNLAYRAHDHFSDGYLHALNLASRLNLPHKTWRDVAFELNR